MSAVYEIKGKGTEYKHCVLLVKSCPTEIRVDNSETTSTCTVDLHREVDGGW